MSLAVVRQVYDETRRLAVAGSNLAQGDFRLKKLVAPLEASAAKAPVFGKVAEAARKLLEGPPDKSPEALLELSSLVSAILYTQGETGLEGPLEPIETTDLGLPSSTAGARVLKPLVDALTSTGSGREEIIRDAFARGAFRDLRMVRVAAAAIDDPYGPIADFIADQVLPLYGKAIYDDARAAYNPKAKGGQVRRLRLLHRLDPERTHELVEQALETGSPDMKVAAIRCLAGRDDMLSYLLEQTRAKSAEVRKAAWEALAPSGADEVAEALIKALSGADLDLAAEPASRNSNPKLLKFLLEEGERKLAEALTLKDKKKLTPAVERFHSLLRCFHKRTDKKSLAFLSACFAKQAEITALAGAFGAEDVNQRVAGLLASSGDKTALRLVADSHASLAPGVLDLALMAATRVYKPNEVFDQFSPYLLAKVEGRKKRGDLTDDKRESVRDVLAELGDAASRRRRPYFHCLDDDGDTASALAEAADVELDPRWLDAAIASDDLELAQALARPGHEGAWGYFSVQLDLLLKKRDWSDYHAADLLETMLQVEHPQAADQFLAALQKLGSSKRAYGGYWLARLIPDLPASAAPRLEALLPSLNEKLVDQIAPYLAELQAKAKAAP